MLKRIKTYFGCLSIRNKMYLILVPVIILLLASYLPVFQTMLTDLKNAAIEKNDQLLSLVCNDIAAQLNILESTASQIIGNAAVKNYARKNATYADKQALQSLLSLDAFHELSTQQNSSIVSFLIVTPTGDYVYAHTSKYLTETLCHQLASYISTYYENNASYTYTPLPHELKKQIDGLCYVLPLSDSDADAHSSLTIGGYLVIISNQYFLRKIMAKYYASDRIITISDKENAVVWSSSPDTPVPGFLLDSTANGNRILRNGKLSTVIVYRHLDKTNWNLSIQIPMQSIESQLTSYKVLYFCCTGAVLALSIFLIFSFSRTITQRLSEMTTVIGNIRDGDIDCRYPVVYQDEISMIGTEFNRMIDQIHKMHFNAVELKLRQREAELHALQSQINPHFLYNSLDCIRSAALVSNNPQVAHQIQILSDMFRYTVGKNSPVNDTVPIEAEVNHVCDYLAILNFRFSDRYTIDMKIDEQILSLYTLRLILQPVVENAFSHGVRSMMENGHITISGFLDNENNCVTLIVEDNGVGISEKELQALTDLLQANPLSVRDTPFLGLININDRIRIAYGLEYGISLESHPGQGFKAIIRLPVLHAQEGVSAC